MTTSYKSFGAYLKAQSRHNYVRSLFISLLESEGLNASKFKTPEQTWKFIEDRTYTKSYSYYKQFCLCDQDWFLQLPDQLDTDTF